MVVITNSEVYFVVRAISTQPSSLKNEYVSRGVSRKLASLRVYTHRFIHCFMPKDRVYLFFCEYLINVFVRHYTHSAFHLLVGIKSGDSTMLHPRLLSPDAGVLCNDYLEGSDLSPGSFSESQSNQASSRRSPIDGYISLVLKMLLVSFSIVRPPGPCPPSTVSYLNVPG